MQVSRLRLFILPVALVASAPAFAEQFSGSAKAIDGDSLLVGTREVRLYGIDAPEFTQTCQREGRSWGCGSDAAFQLSKLVNSKQINCTSLGVDTHGRTLARCKVGETDINRTLVATGYAVAYRRYSMDYVSAEESAKLARRGIWTSTFELPSQVRHDENDYVLDRPSDRGPSRELPAVSSARSRPQPSGNCRIKGNHSRKGELIYHLPGIPYYAETKAEQIFCTEAQARAAGYRRSRADQHR
jgi:endonuclease YncB( thermonuclease family)